MHVVFTNVYLRRWLGNSVHKVWTPKGTQSQQKMTQCTSTEANVTPAMPYIGDLH